MKEKKTWLLGVVTTSMFIISLLATAASAGTIMIPVPIRTEKSQVPRTGQTPSLPTQATPNSDGDLQKGIAWPTPRFTDNNNGTVTDNLTDLVWLKNANCLTDSKNWHDALSYVATEIYDEGGEEPEDDCGLSDGSRQGDWRLPNVNELSSLVAWQYAHPALTNLAGNRQCNLYGWDCGFKNVVHQPPGTPYWSSSTSAKDPNRAWGISFSAGGVSHMDKYTIRCFIWPVRDK